MLPFVALSVLVAAVSADCDAQIAAQLAKPGLPTNRPFNVAHRGASGILPEHTAAAYEAGIAQGADFIECDMVLTKDLHIVCRHEPDLKDTTDALEKFPELLTTYEIDGEEVEGIFTTDLTLEQIKTLKAIQPRDFRNPNYNGEFDVPTLEEYIEIALGADRVIGIYPETKHPMWHNSLDITEGTSFEDIVVKLLSKYCYGGNITSDTWAAQPIFIQSFEVGNLKYLSGITDMPLVQLLGGWEGYVTPDNGLTHAEMTTDEALDEIATYASGVGPWKDTIIPINLERYAEEPTNLVEAIQSRGMQVHPYTFRNEDEYLSWTWEEDIYQEYDAFFKKMGIDGCFTDQPGTLTRYFKYEYLAECPVFEPTMEPDFMSAMPPVYGGYGN